MVLVVGATGQLCSRIVHGLLGKGHRVRALVTHASAAESVAGHGPMTTIQSLIQAGAKPIWGDLKNRTSLRAAVSGVDTVIAATNPMKFWGKDSIQSTDWDGTWNLIDESRLAGVRRFLLATIPAVAANHSGQATQTSQIVEEYEQLLKASGMTYTIVQPTILMEPWIGMMIGIPLMTQQTVTLIGRGDHAHNFVSEQDVADYFVAMVNHPDAFNQRVVVGGPASYTWTEIVNQVRQWLGADLPIQYAMTGTPIPYLPDGANSLASHLERFEDHLDITQTAATFGVRPTTLVEYIERTYSPFP